LIDGFKSFKNINISHEREMNVVKYFVYLLFCEAREIDYFL